MKAKTAPKQRPVEVLLAPVDNTLLANLCGPLDENIRQIETAYDVTIARRNERFTIRGDAASRTAEALQHFYVLARQPLAQGLIVIEDASDQGEYLGGDR